MPTLTIDGKQVTVEPGTTVIQAAEKLGLFVPRYCYHPGLSIAGNCRICLVDIEKNPKLQIACNTPVADGMVVRTQGEKVEQGRQAVLEFLLINHPLDCPVCDQSGECDLQNFYMQYGLYDPKFREKKVKKVKAVPIGPAVMLDAERCILCSRCVRFTDEVSHTHEFGIFNRGDRSQIGLYPGKELDNKYSGNVVDMCPVGALTDRDFRFKARVWYLKSAPSVCTGCSKGCNIDIHYVLDRPHLSNGARVMRLKPRTNPDVNQWWMCDEGRYGYHFIDQGRLRKVVKRGAQVTWHAAIQELANLLRETQAAGQISSVGVIASAQLTTEELFLIRKLFKESLGISNCTANVPEKPGSSDNFLIQADKNPNTLGATLIGLTGPGSIPATDIIQQALAGTIKVLWVFGHDLGKLFGAETLQKLSENLDHLIFQGSNENGSSEQAHWILPGAVAAEKDGVFVNCDGRAQRLVKAFEPLAEAKPEWEVLLELGKHLGAPIAAANPKEIFEMLTKEVQAFSGLTYEKLALQGVQLSLKSHPRGSEDLVEGFPLSRE